MFELANKFFISLIYACFLIFIIIGLFMVKQNGEKYSVKFVVIDYANKDVIQEFYNNLRDELSHTDEFFSGKIPHCYGKCSNENNFQRAAVNYVHEVCKMNYSIWEDENTLRIKSDKSGKGDARKSVPCYLQLKPSNIPQAGLGIFTTIAIGKGVIFGPYTGERTDVAKTKINSSGYNWSVYYKERKFNVDGVDINKTNWLRYVNSPRYGEEQNLYPISAAGDMYYFVMKDIKPGEELLVWYGSKYGRYLGINFARDYHKNRKDSMIAPWRKDMNCSTCL